MNNRRLKDFDSTKSRRSKASLRRMTPADAPLDQLEPNRLAVQEAVMPLMRESEQVLNEVRE